MTHFPGKLGWLTSNDNREGTMDASKQTSKSTQSHLFEEFSCDMLVPPFRDADIKESPVCRVFALPLDESQMLWRLVTYNY